MSILDDAIREHLELKRAHGADDVELKRLEDEAFGPPQRPDEPDPFAEAPTEFLVAPEVGAGEQADEEPGGRRVPNIADLQEAPPVRRPRRPPRPRRPTTARPRRSTRRWSTRSPTPATRPRSGTRSPSSRPRCSTSRASSRTPPPSPTLPPTSSWPTPRWPSPASPRSTRWPGSRPAAPPRPRSPAEPAAEEDEPADEFDDFFSEQRLSDELNQALEAPLPDEPGAPATEEAPAVFVDLDEEDEAEYEEEPAEEPSDEYEVPAPAEDEDDEEEDTPPPAPAASSHEDVLEDTPEFLEDAPEDDDLWFEQKPPKDFDFDD